MHRDIGSEGRRSVLVVLSPHLDDAVLSLGALMHDLATRLTVRVVTVFARDPLDPSPPSAWDSVRVDPGTGQRVETAGAAIAQRHAEDDAAMRELGIAPGNVIRLTDFLDPVDRGPGQGLHPGLEAALAEACAGADLLLAPGLPLAHPGHLELCRVVRNIAERLPPLGYYKELPYGASPWPIARERRRGATAHLLPADLHWYVARVTREALTAKQAASLCYAGEIDRLHVFSTRARLAYPVFGREVVALRAGMTIGPALETLLRPGASPEVRLSLGRRRR